MHSFSNDVMSITLARARLTEIAAEVVASGHPKVLTRNGASYVAVVGVADLDDYHRLRAADHLRNLQDLSEAAREIAAGKAMSVEGFRKEALALVNRAKAAKPSATVQKKRMRRLTK
jgi:PHD/YefM family antitoxin component YafN of YafNO toxin-antitoxin module